MANEFTLGVGQAHEMELAMKRCGHWNSGLVQELCVGNRLAFIREYLLGLSDIRRIDCTVDLDAPPSVPNGWLAEEHTKGGLFQFDPVKVRPHLEEEQKTGTINGHTLREFIVKHHPFNANLLDWYVKSENQRFIPEDWKKYGDIFFWGTIYRRPDGALCVRCLKSSLLGWYGSFRELLGFWSASNPALVPA